jgi:hypothetical protein
VTGARKGVGRCASALLESLRQWFTPNDRKIAAKQKPSAFESADGFFVFFPKP